MTQIKPAHYNTRPPEPTTSAWPTLKTFNIDNFCNAVDQPELADWLQIMLPAINARLDPGSQRNFPRWLAALNSLPELPLTSPVLDQDVITTIDDALTDATRQSIHNSLMQLHPWRKGPFSLHGVSIDTEWRCEKKWARLAPHINLSGRRILDVGCGNGYYCLRMLGAGARTVVGLDTSLLYCTQFQAINHFTGQDRACVLPLGVEVLQEHKCEFDTIFSMGVLYHRRQPVEHLKLLHSCLAPGGEMILETLIIAGDDSNELIPDGRYANMRNVWSLPTVSLLLQQLKSAGFSAARCVDVTQTSLDEQRPTDWMTFHSLQHALDPNDNCRTIEGHPAPVRAILIAEK